MKSVTAVRFERRCGLCKALHAASQPVGSVGVQEGSSPAAPPGQEGRGGSEAAAANAAGARGFQTAGSGALRPGAGLEGGLQRLLRRGSCDLLLSVLLFFLICSLNLSGFNITVSIFLGRSRGGFPKGCIRYLELRIHYSDG